MSESWDDYADGWDTNENIREYSNQAFNSLIKNVDLNGLDVIDFGCGTGLLTEKIAPLVNYTLAIDSSEKMITILQSKNIANVESLMCELTQKHIDSNPVLQRKYDLIVASSVCSFLDDYYYTLKLLRTLLKSGGMLVQWDWLKANKDSPFGFSSFEVLTAYKRAGFECVAITQPFEMKDEQGTMPVLMGIARKKDSVPDVN